MALTRIAKIPYLNSLPFFRGLQLGGQFELTECVPRELGVKARSGEIDAGLLSLVDYLSLGDQFERVGHFGIAVRGRAHSAFLFSRKPLQQLEGSPIAVSGQTSTTSCLLRLLFEQRYRIKPCAYLSGKDHPEAEALLLIGDDALRMKHNNTQYPYEVDVAHEWWLWQHMPFVFAVWAVRQYLSSQMKRQIELALIKALAMNLSRLQDLAQESSKALGIPEEILHVYLSHFVYRLSQSEEEAILRFRGMAEECGLLSEQV